MKPTLTRWSALRDDERDGFLRRFAACAVELREGPFARCAPPVAYTERVIALALQRPHEFYLVTAGDRITGRAAVVTSLASPDAAAMGLFESTPGPDAHATTTLLTEAARAWACAHERSALYAPVDVNTWFSYRFLLPQDGGGSTFAPYSWEPAQPPEYPAMFCSQGFEEAGRFQSDVVQYDRCDAATPARAAATAFDDATAAGFRFERVGDRGIEDMMDELHPLCMSAFRDNPLFEHIPLDLFRNLYRDSESSRDCSLTQWARDPEGRLVGFVFAFIDGDAVVIKTIAVSPAARGRRLSTALVHPVFDGAARRGYRTFISALVRHDNPSALLTRKCLSGGRSRETREYVLLRASSAGR